MNNRDTSADGTDTLRTDTEALRTEIAAALIAARNRTSALTTAWTSPT